MMTSPYTHTHVSHLTRMKRRRSQSVTIPNSGEQDTLGQSIRRKQFFAQLQMERQKQQNNGDGQNEEHQQDEEDHHQPIVTRVPGGNTSTSVKKHTSSKAATSLPAKEQLSSTTFKSVATEEDEEYHPVVTQIAGSTITTSAKKHTSLTAAMSAAVVKKEIPSTAYKTTYMQEEEQYYNYHSQFAQIPGSDSTRSLNKQLSATPSKPSNANIFTKYKNTNLGSPTTCNDLDLDSSQISSNPFATSTTNIMPPSDIVDQEFNLNDSKDHARRNDVKGHGNIKISEREKFYTIHGRKLPTKSSASFMAAVIAIIIGGIAFALGLTAFILVLLLRSTVATSLASSGRNSTATSGGSGTFPSSCSAYTTLNDPTRNVYAVGYALGCDNTAPFMNQSVPVWIRFTGTGGTTLPLSTPGMNICGTESTGWYDGTMPSSTGQITNGTACFTWYTSVCRYSAPISVANCGSFYIYYLPPPPVCMARYCTL